MNPKRWLSMLLALVMVLSLIPASVFAADGDEPKGYQIVIGEQATEMQEYAAKELRTYLYQLTDEDIPVVTAKEGMDLTNTFVVGTQACNPLVSAVKTELDSLATTGADGHEGEQGYVLKKVDSTLYIAGTDDAGTLYGVYGLLDDYYGIGFYFSGDAIPENYTGPMMPEVNEAKTPRQYMRGVLPWTNFPQSATVYSTEDWMYVIDQMARMRMNFLNIHNYNGQNGHNEVFHNFTYNGITSRNWNATASSGHGWGCKGWDVNKYRFGGTDLFDDYDFGTDATLHNDSLDNVENFAKGWSQFQFIIDYAHSRGVKMGLGLDIDLVMPDYGVSATAEGLPELQAQTVMDNYEDLDTLILYVSEMITSNPTALENWKNCFTRMYNTVRAERPDMQIAISGWGISKEIAAFVPDDVVIAPISNYSAGFVDGSVDYPDKEYWGGPWMERDFDSSVYFYPFKMELSDTITSYQQNKDNMEGMFTLSWRLTDGVDAKMSYIAKAPWDLEDKYQTAEDVYGEYAEKCYGKEAAETLTDIICNQEKTVVPTLWSECNGTFGIDGGDRQADIEALQGMIDQVDAAMALTSDSGQKTRIQKLRDRLVSAQYFCKLDQNFGTTEWENLQDEFSVWAQSFMTRVDDISSLGNVQSTQNRFVQENYVARETALRNEQDIKAPLNVVAKGTKTGAVLTWEYEDGMAEGFNVYRDGTKINDEMLGGDVRSYTDTYDGTAVYTVKAVVNYDDPADESDEMVLTEGTASIAQTCDAGNADETAPQAIVVSPSTSARAGQDLKVKARILDGRTYDSLSAQIHYRALGSDGAFTVEEMEHRTKATFTADIDTTAFVNTGIEYYVTVSDGSNTGVWPATAKTDGSGLNAACTVYSNTHTDSVLRAPTKVTADNGGISWNDVGGDVFWYKIYRGDSENFQPSSATFVTYVEAGTNHFTDVDSDFDGSKLSDKTTYYRVTAVDRYLNESIPSMAVQVGETILDPLSQTLFIKADQLYKSSPAAQAGSSTGTVVAWTEDGGWAKFEDLQFSKSVGLNAVEIRYSANQGGGHMDVWLDGPSVEDGGTMLGGADLPDTGNWATFSTVTIPLEPPVTGTHDVYFVFSRLPSTSQYLFNLDHFRFTCVAQTGEDDLLFTTEDMMAYKTSKESTMREDEPSITNFGNAGDRIALGEGFRASKELPAIMGGGTQLAALPGYGVQCFAFFNSVGAYFGYENVPAGNVYLAYDKCFTGDDHELAVYVNDEAVEPLKLPDNTGSWWGGDGRPAEHKVMYLDTGVVSDGDDTIRFQIDTMPTDAPSGLLNGVKLFVTKDYTAKQIDITYANSADTQYSLYVDGEDVATVVLPNSNGQKKTVSIELDVEGYIELVADNDDLIANGATQDAETEAINNDGAKSTIYQMLLRQEATTNVNTVTVAASEGGSVSPSGTVEVPTGDSLTLTFAPDEGYYVKNVVINGVSYGSRSSYTFESLTFDATVDVTFEAEPAGTRYNVTIGELSGGTITAPATAQPGEPVTLDVKPNGSYKLKAGSLKYVTESNPDGVAINEYSTQFAMPGEDVTITAEFEYVGGGGSSSSSSYTITVTQATGGKISPSTTSVKKGEDKTFTITASEGYKISDVLVDGKSVGAVSTYTFKNVTAKHTITAKFEKTEDVTNVGGFVDVKSDAWYAEAVQYVVDEGLMNGTSETSFTPNGATTRGMIVTILYRQAGSPKVVSDKATWWSDARVWAMENGVSDGTNMDKEITREQLATMLYRYTELQGEDVSKTTSLDSFKDGNKVSAYAVDALKWAAAEGIVTGKTGNIIDPQAGATRAETATMFMRLSKL